MEECLQHYAQQAPFYVLLIVIGIMIYTLSKGADWLVEEAATLSVKWRMPKALIGATVVSLGTTLPEAAVSVLAAIQGQPELAMGNAVGSIICDTGLILGLAAIITPLPLVRSVVNRQGWMQLAAGVLLVMAALPFALGLQQVWTVGGIVAQWKGFVFLGLLVLYIWLSIRWARGESHEHYEIPLEERGSAAILLKLAGGIALVVISSQILIPAVEETALRIGVPTSVVAATLVAFGTSLPELVTAMTAVRRGHGEIAVGNVIGADILNVLFVVGAAASVTSGGLIVPPLFFKLLFPAMLGVLILFRVFVATGGNQLKRIHGIILLTVYVIVTVCSYR